MPHSDVDQELESAAKAGCAASGVESFTMAAQRPATAGLRAAKRPKLASEALQ